MSTILDVTVIAIIVLSVFFGIKNGFFKTLLGFGSLIMAIIVVLLFQPTLSQTFMKSSTAISAREAINEKLTELIVSDTEKDESNTEEAKNDGEAGLLKIKGLLEKVGINMNGFEQKWSEFKENKTESLRDTVVESVSEPLINGVASVTAFVILFFGTLIIVKIAAFFIDKIFTLPVLREANKILGGLLGGVLAVIRVSAFCYIINLVIPLFRAMETPLLSRMDADATVLFSFFENLDLISLVL